MLESDAVDVLQSYATRCAGVATERYSFWKSRWVEPLRTDGDFRTLIVSLRGLQSTAEPQTEADVHLSIIG